MRKKTAITGYKSSGPDGQLAFIDAARQSGRTDPVPGRVSPGIPGYASAPFTAAVPVAERYHPVTNPRGARGTVYDAAKNAYGVDGRTGFALRPFDDVGVQYGLKALNAGVITPQQFLDLNERIGGFDQDANFVASRSAGDTGAIRRPTRAASSSSAAAACPRSRWSTSPASTTTTRAITTSGSISLRVTA